MKKLFRFAPARGERFVLQGREMVEEEAGLFGAALDQIARHLDQRAGDEPGRAAQRGQLLARQRRGREHQRNRLRPTHQTERRRAALRFARKLIPGCRLHLQEQLFSFARLVKANPHGCDTLYGFRSTTERTERTEFFRKMLFSVRSVVDLKGERALERRYLRRPHQPASARSLRGGRRGGPWASPILRRD